MSDNSLTAPHPSSAMVPAEFAEKAMGSLMKLHTELVDEKDRRVELYRKLMEKEQALAELKMYVKLLEEKVQKLETPAPAAPLPQALANAAAAAPVPETAKAPAREPLHVVRTETPPREGSPLRAPPPVREAPAVRAVPRPPPPPANARAARTARLAPAPTAPSPKPATTAPAAKPSRTSDGWKAW